MFKKMLGRLRIEKVKRELAEIDFLPLYVDMDFVDPDTGMMLARADSDVAEEDTDRVLYLTLVDDRSRYCLIDNIVFWASGCWPD